MDLGQGFCSQASLPVSVHNSVPHHQLQGTEHSYTLGCGRALQSRREHSKWAFCLLGSADLKEEGTSNTGTHLGCDCWGLPHADGRSSQTWPNAHSHHLAVFLSPLLPRSLVAALVKDHMTSPGCPPIAPKLLS